MAGVVASNALVILGLVAAGILAVAVGHPHLAWVVAAGVVWNGAWGPVPSLYQAAAVRTRAASPELAGAWINATSNIGIATGAVLGGRALDAAGIPAVAWLALVLIAVSIVILAVARGAFDAAPAPAQATAPMAEGLAGASRSPSASPAGREPATRAVEG
ncbi:hypothetical protein OEB99_13880 [Actinotalea sp. M2MS4P-6]|uniref:hypothetical protein n=1 Tax=Actinotalea sp. M2MS4P-6 TaxID=2983762 RepID=UPI0021E4903D|nr:hypothetical protein [Actinotalea sp. M2MS4P-6]MCV2395401.1 hypothetical protein [Actinotalea sp. M2MS4P-6]